MKKKGKIHYVFGKNFFASCDGNKRMTPGQFNPTDIKADVTCGRCLKMIALRETREKRIAVQGDIYPTENGLVVAYTDQSAPAPVYVKTESGLTYFTFLGNTYRYDTTLAHYVIEGKDGTGWNRTRSVRVLDAAKQIFNR